MEEYKAPSQQYLLDSYRSNDSVQAESLQVDAEDALDDAEYAIPTVLEIPTLESVLSGDFESKSEFDTKLVNLATPSLTENVEQMPNRIGFGSIMRYALLQGVSAQISSATNRINSGFASACAVCDYIAIGTSHGHVLNFDITQTLRWAYQDKNGQGAVTTLSFNLEGTRILAGYARGLIKMFDTQKGDVLRNLTNVVTTNTGILHVKWTSHTSLALCADSGGSIWSLSFTRKFGIRGCTSGCIFSGSRGEVCTVEPLILDDSRESGSVNHFAELDEYCIVALATLAKYFIITIRPRLKVIKHHALNGPPDCLPLLAWQMVLIQAADNKRSVDPVIVVGKGQQLFFHQLFISNGRISILYLRYVQLKTNLLSAHWLGPKHVVCIDTEEILHLIDVRSSRELEYLDMANVGLVYASAQFKGLATGGNVSPALALVGTHACYNSLFVRGSQLYILGARSLNMIGVRNWGDRISYLVKNQRWQEACEVALVGYRKANNATSSRYKRRIQAKERILLLFEEYLLASSFVHKHCLSAIVNCVITVGESDRLWSQLWDRLKHNNKTAFLEIVSEHIYNDNIRYLNPIISQALIDYWSNVSLKKLEEVILKLDWTCLDLNQTIKAAKNYNLYRAQIFLNTQAMNDYTISLTELIPLLHKGAVKHTSELGNYLLVYISSCLAGRGYPVGDIPHSDMESIKCKVLRCLTSPYNAVRNNIKKDPILPYPYLRALLKFDTRETLNAISLAFKEKEFNGQQGQTQRKRIIDILLQIMTPDNATLSEIGYLLSYIAQQIAWNSIPHDPVLLNKVLNYITSESIADESSRQHAERENAWHELLINNCLINISSDEKQLELSQRAKCYCVAEFLLEKLNRHENILDCYLLYESRHDAVFSYIEQHVGVPERHIYKQLKSNFPLLLKINASETIRIIKTYYMSKLDILVHTVQNEPELAFILLKELHNCHVGLSKTYCEQYIALLCVHGTRKELIIFLTTSDDMFDAGKALSLVKRYRIPEAIILIHEQQNQYTQAFDVALQMLQECHRTETEIQLSRITVLCARACLNDKKNANLWLRLLKVVLARADLKELTNMFIFEYSQYIDLQQIVQLIMGKNELCGSLSDMKTLLLDMLYHARNEKYGIVNSIQIYSTQFHSIFVTKLNQFRRGFFVTNLRCSYCQQCFFSNSSHFTLSGYCSHSFHDLCAHDHIQTEQKLEEGDIRCFLCQQKRPSSCQCTLPIELSAPDSKIFGFKTVFSSHELKLKAPPVNLY